jgi:hypothetical protein
MCCCTKHKLARSIFVGQSEYPPVQGELFEGRCKGQAPTSLLFGRGTIWKFNFNKPDSGHTGIYNLLDVL